MRILLGAMALCAMLEPAAAAELAVAPADSLIAVSARNRGYYDLVIPTVAVRAAESERLQNLRLTIELLRNGQVTQSRFITAGDMAADTGGLMEAGVPGFVNGQLLNSAGVSGLFGKPTEFAKSAVVDSGQALFSFGNAFLSKGQPDQVRIVAEALGNAGKPVKIVKIVPIADYQSPISYRAPLRGTWLMTALPGLRDHHRLNPSTEFALDFFKPDADGRLWHDDPLVAGNFIAFGADVLAVADGVVVAVSDGDVQDRGALMRKPDEAPAAASRRIQAYNMARYTKDFPRAAAGNLVVVRHESGGVIEYSAYGHLKAGVAVKVGQMVKQGDKIGEVGDTGDSAVAHLHFQLNAGSDPFTSKSLPVRFTGVKNPTGIEDVVENGNRGIRSAADTPLPFSIQRLDGAPPASIHPRWGKEAASSSLRKYLRHILGAYPGHRRILPARGR